MGSYIQATVGVGPTKYGALTALRLRTSKLKSYILASSSNECTCRSTFYVYKYVYIAGKVYIWRVDMNMNAVQT